MDDVVKKSNTSTASPPWPKFLVATLTLLGVFQGRPLQVTRPCILCRRKPPGDDVMSKLKNKNAFGLFVCWGVCSFVRLFVRLFVGVCVYLLAHLPVVKYLFL